MPEPIPFTYRAFLSYSHRDKAWAAWLHRALEHTRIDKDLVGRQTPVGPVPATLRPVFRDRDDFAAGHSLTEQTLAALEGSQFLVAICSPNAARSPYVNEEIRRFKAMGRGDRIIPLIVDGEPGDPERECFPPAIRFKLNPDGSIGTELEEPIAADAREIGDGKRAALIKITAGLLGVRLDEIIRRADRALARQRRIRFALVGSFVMLVVVGSGGIAWGYRKSLENDDLMDGVVRIATGFVSEATDMSDKLGIPASVPLALLTRADAALSGYIAKGKDSPKLRYRRAQTLLDLSENYAKLGQTAQRAQRVLEARSLLEALAAELPHNSGVQSILATAYTQAANVMLAQGAPPEEVLAQYRKGLKVREHLVETNPGVLGAQSDLSISYERIADLLVSQNKLTEAADIIGALVALRERIAKAMPGDLDAQQHLAIAYDRAGQVAFDRGMLDEAIRLYRMVVSINERLVAAAPTNTTYLRDLAISHNALAQTLAQTDAAGAVAEAKVGLEMRKRLAASDLSNAIWQLDLAVSYETLAAVRRLTSEWPESLADYQAAYTIRQKFAAADPNNVDTLRALTIARNGVASMLAVLGKTDEALALYRENLAVRQKLADGSPTTAQWQLDLAQIHWAIGSLLAGRKAFEEALRHYEKGLAITEAVAASDATNLKLQRQISYLSMHIGEIHRARDDAQSAIKAYRKSVAINAPLVAANPALVPLTIELVVARRALVELGDEPMKQLEEMIAAQQRLLDLGLLAAEFRHSLVVDYSNLAKLHLARGATAPAIEAGRKADAILTSLLTAEPGNAPMRLELVMLHWGLAAHGDDTLKRMEGVVAMLRRLKDEGLLKEDQLSLLRAAEAELAKLKP